MVFWPFGRKRNKIDREKATMITNEDDTTQALRDKRQSRKLQKRYSFSPDRREELRVPSNEQPLPKRSTRHSPPRNAIIHPQTWSHTGVAETIRADTGMSSTIPQDQDWPRVPTLSRRAKHDIPRRKSSKRKREDLSREAEIKALSLSMPKSTASSRYSSAVSSHKRGHLGHQALSVDSVSAKSANTAEKHSSIKLRGMLSPHPTIRYSQAALPAQTPHASGVFETLPSGAKRWTGSQAPFSRDNLHSKQRIDDLANDLSTHELRELMERDARRRGRKQIADQERLNKRLQRRLTRQDMTAVVPVQASATAGLDSAHDRTIAGTTNTSMSTPLRRRVSSISIRKTGQRPSSLNRAHSNVSQRPSFVRSPSLAPTESELPERSIVETAQVARLSRANMSPPSSPAPPTISSDTNVNIPQSPEDNKYRHVIPVLPDEAYINVENSPQQPQSWKAFFKRSPAVKKGSTVPSFSNTSRDSALSGLHPILTYDSRVSSSGNQMRTVSRFVEDLPDFPVSPPASRYGSPDGDRLPPIFTGYSQRTSGHSNSVDISEINARRHDTPTSGYRSIDAKSKLRNEPSTSFSRSTDTSSPEPSGFLSHSLASVDSEASWLSGKQRPSERASSLMVQRRAAGASATSLAKSDNDVAEESTGETSLLRNSNREHDEAIEASQVSTSSHNALPIDQYDEEIELGDSPTSVDAKWGALGRRPTIISHVPRVVSVDGMLNTFGTDFDEESISTPVEQETEPYADSPVTTFDTGRAISVNLGKSHRRAISSGSAKKIDIRPRTPGNDVEVLSKVQSCVEE